MNVGIRIVNKGSVHEKLMKSFERKVVFSLFCQLDVSRDLSGSKVVLHILTLLIEIKIKAHGSHFIST